jgi:hypothetical protein
MRIRLSTDLLSGVLFLALGAFAMIYGSRYGLGTAARMGPGYYPLLASSGLIVMGLVLVVRSMLRTTEAVGDINVRPLVLVLAGTLAFGLLIDRIGFIVASAVLVIAARLGERGFKPVEVAILVLGLIAFTLAIFRYGLGMPLKLWPV